MKIGEVQQGIRYCEPDTVGPGPTMLRNGHCDLSKGLQSRGEGRVSQKCVLCLRKTGAQPKTQPGRRGRKITWRR